MNIEASNMTLEEQVKSLQEQINFLKSGGNMVSPNSRLQRIRQQCREKHFGTWEDMRNGSVDYGPEGKKYSDYDAVRDIVRRVTDLVFRYSKGARAGRLVTSLIESEDDFREYEGVCEAVCCGLKEKLTSLQKEQNKMAAL